ncbi:MAG: class I SAM-dependent methyltransferase [Pyrinomonadaceae bacterium]|nr:class I SAM-dependent methyltransferase [Pyrinomonadaceae bacterium]
MRKNKRHHAKQSVEAAAPYSNYDPFSWFYERYWCEDVPPAIFTVIERLLLPEISKKSRILDVCCGTGYTVARLERQGYSVAGLDGSEQMLRFARKHAPRSAFVLADARRFNLPQIFDAALATFDSLNHLMTLAELEAAMTNVHRALRPAGLFLFDMNLESGFLNHWADYFSIVEPDEVCVLRGQYDREQRVGRYDITMFRLEGEAWQRSDAVITERCYSMKEIKGALTSAGFKDFSVFDAERDLGLTDHTGRKFFLAKKEN